MRYTCAPETGAVLLSSLPEIGAPVTWKVGPPPLGNVHPVRATQHNIRTAEIRFKSVRLSEWKRSKNDSRLPHVRRAGSQRMSRITISCVAGGALLTDSHNRVTHIPSIDMWGGWPTH